MTGKLLILGASGKYRSSDIYSWRRMETEVPLIGDYSNVIIYLPGFNKESFEAPNVYASVISKIHKGVTDALNGTTHIHFIAAPPTQFPNHTSYKLFPFSISHDVENGKTFKSKDESFPYLSKLTGWQVAFKDNANGFSTSELSPALRPLARTNHEKNAAFRIDFHNPRTGNSAGVVDVLPPLFDKGVVSEEKTINELINHYSPIDSVEVKLPERYQQMALPGEAELKKEDGELEQTIISAKARRETIKTDLAVYDELKGVVALKGKPLEHCVDSALKKLHIDYEPTETNKEDGNLVLAASLRVPVEIKGHETKGASEQDLRQVIARLSDETADEAVRGILIVNPFYTLAEEEQAVKKAFESSVVQQAKAFKIALLDTRVLLKYVADQLKDGVNDLLGALSTTTGETSYHKPQVEKKQDD